MNVSLVTPVPLVASEAREAASRFVSTALVMPVFAQLRQTDAAAGPFAPGAAEKQFGPMLDQMLADRLTSASNFKLVDAIVDRLGGNG